MLRRSLYSTARATESRDGPRPAAASWCFPSQYGRLGSIEWPRRSGERGDKAWPERRIELGCKGMMPQLACLLHQRFFCWARLRERGGEGHTKKVFLTDCVGKELVAAHPSRSRFPLRIQEARIISLGRESAESAQGNTIRPAFWMMGGWLRATGHETSGPPSLPLPLSLPPSLPLPLPPSLYLYRVCVRMCVFVCVCLREGRDCVFLPIRGKHHTQSRLKGTRKGGARQTKSFTKLRRRWRGRGQEA